MLDRSCGAMYNVVIKGNGVFELMGSKARFLFLPNKILNKGNGVFYVIAHERRLYLLMMKKENLLWKPYRIISEVWCLTTE